MATSGLDAVIGQERAIGQLRRMLENDRLPHALLFSGIEGVGKRMAARALAMTLNCRMSDRVSACMTCRTCRQMMSGNHPDVISVSPAGNYIKLDQVRAVRKQLRFAPLDGANRVVIISDAHRMNVEAANAMLKLLEEPPADTYVVMTCLQVSDLVPTILSRCRQIPFNPLPLATIAREVMEQRGLALDTATAVASLAKGSMGKALACNAEKWMGWRRRCLEEFAMLPDGPLYRVLSAAESLSKQKEKVPDVLDLFLVWVRDLLMCKLRHSWVVNTDWSTELSGRAGEVSVAGLLEAISAVFSAQQAVSGNANSRLVLEVLFMRYRSVFAGQEKVSSPV